jgi:hypothetical protein
MQVPGLILKIFISVSIFFSNCSLKGKMVETTSVKFNFNFSIFRKIYSLTRNATKKGHSRESKGQNRRSIFIFFLNKDKIKASK